MKAPCCNVKANMSSETVITEGRGKQAIRAGVKRKHHGLRSKQSLCAISVLREQCGTVKHFQLLCAEVVQHLAHA